MNPGDPAYVALCDRLAARARDRIDEHDGPDRTLVILQYRSGVTLVDALLDMPDPILAAQLYRDHVRQCLQSIDESEQT